MGDGRVSIKALTYMTNPKAYEAPNILPHLRAAVKAQVELHLALRAIERKIGFDSDKLDDYLTSLAFKCRTPAEADNLPLADATECIAHCFGAKEGN